MRLHWGCSSRCSCKPSKLRAPHFALAFAHLILRQSISSSLLTGVVKYSVLSAFVGMSFAAPWLLKLLLSFSMLGADDDGPMDAAVAVVTSAAMQASTA